MLTHHHFCDFFANANHFVAMITIGDDINVGQHVVKDGEAIGCEASNSARWCHVIDHMAAFKAFHTVGKAACPIINKIVLDCVIGTLCAIGVNLCILTEIFWYSPLECRVCRV